MSVGELPSHYQSVIHRSRYARFIPEKHRRETWVESVDRYVNYMYKTAKNTSISQEDLALLYDILGATCER